MVSLSNKLQVHACAVVQGAHGPEQGGVRSDAGAVRSCFVWKDYQCTSLLSLFALFTLLTLLALVCSVTVHSDSPFCSGPSPPTIVLSFFVFFGGPAPHSPLTRPHRPLPPSLSRCTGTVTSPLRRTASGRSPPPWIWTTSSTSTQSKPACSW